ncbi:MAG: hypothetical protein Q8R61_13885 [Thiobacillus sp.]|uniref:hypothetical protein n=1 Tax=Thiobacillus sp. TaxID=924 RepID=UPI002736E9EA|nr:hypothetical protein [Thiobacillus sp.]MDP3586216.1 hypothetical protein [Thiobacillus sp.]
MVNTAIGNTILTRLLRTLWLAATMLIGAETALAAGPDASAAAALHAHYAALGERLHNNPFRRALTLDSSESDNEVKGDIHARIDYPFFTVQAALNDPAHWCDVLILHINTKHCRATTDADGTVLAVSIGKKTPQPIKDAYPIEFSYRVVTATSNYLELRLHAPQGPLSTHDYHIQLQAVPVENGRTFLRLTYSYDYGTAGRIAMKTYLATLGSGKVGFTRTGRQPGGAPEHIGGMRGAIERNAMRYYLAIDAYLATYGTPSAQQLQQRLHTWFSATEQYPRQLRELDRTAYIDMKRSEYQRQQAVQ